MEVFLSPETIQSLSLLQYGLSNTVSDGFLIGHKRGGLFFIEKAFPSQKGFFSSLGEYFELKQKLDDKLLGFYSFQTNESKLKKILAPVAYGKVYLRIEANHTDRLEIKPFIIEYDQDFYLLPIDLKPIP
jgi:hypothetical protein